MQDCIFCKIVAGKEFSHKIYEDDSFFGLLDIYPKSKGHSLLIPKKHYRWVHEVPNFGEYWEGSLKIAKALQVALSPKWVQYFTHGSVPHAHIHIVPRYDKIETAGPLPTETLKFSKEEFSEFAEKIKKALKGKTP